MTATTTTPAVYVGTYHKYNCGSIAGKWLDLTDFDGADDFYEACRALHQNETDPEFMFQDCEGIPSQFFEESSIDWDFIEAYKEARDAGKDGAFIAWVEHSGKCDFDEFDDAYHDEAKDEEAFAIEYVADNGLLNGLPSDLHSYFDYEAYARDLFINDFVFKDGYVFRAC